MKTRDAGQGKVTLIFDGVGFFRSDPAREVDQQGCGLAVAGQRPVYPHDIAVRNEGIGDGQLGIPNRGTIR